MGVGVVLAGSLVAGCIATPASRTAATRDDSPALRRSIERRVAIRTAVARVRVEAPRVAASPVVATPSPWEQYVGTLEGPSYAVAHARGPRLPVAATMGGPAITALPNPTKVGAPRVALVVAEVGDWLQVLLPLRPNNSVGWVQRRDVDVARTTVRVEIDRAARRVRVVDADTVVMDEPVAVGRAATPTPSGQFFVTELLRPPNPAGAYGPYAFTLSGYSTVFQRFGSGDGAVGLHGTNQPRALGSDASHGCVRLSNEAIGRLAALLPLGTPVLIR